MGEKLQPAKGGVERKRCLKGSEGVGHTRGTSAAVRSAVWPNPPLPSTQPSRNPPTAPVSRDAASARWLAELEISSVDALSCSAAAAICCAAAA